MIGHSLQRREENYGSKEVLIPKTVELYTYDKLYIIYIIHIMYNIN